MPEPGTPLLNVCPPACHLSDYIGVALTGPGLPGQLGGQRKVLVLYRYTQEGLGVGDHLIYQNKYPHNKMAQW